MKFFMFFFFVVYTYSGYTQNQLDYESIDRIALTLPRTQTNTTADIAAYIRSNFDTDIKKVRGIFTWVAANISYSTDSLHPIIFEEDRDHRNAIVLRRRKGVCENYANIFNDICVKSNMRSLLIEGYTKQNGFMDRSPHAWCAVFINNKWFLYDPTWDEDRAHRGTFSGNTEYNYFQVLPEEFIQTHMPFDPMFQFLNFPVTYKEFNNGNTQINNSKPYFNYADSVAAYEKSNYLDKYLSSAQRIEKNGTAGTMVSNKVKQLKMDIEIIYQDNDTTLYNDAVADYNNALSFYNTFVIYRNNRFTPSKPDAEVQSIFENIEKKIAAANIKINEVNHSKADLTLNTEPLQKVLNDLSAHVKEQQAFLKDYSSNAKVK